MAPEHLTRQIYWSPQGGLPWFFPFAMYFLFGLGFCVMAWGFWRLSNRWQFSLRQMRMRSAWNVKVVVPRLAGFVSQMIRKARALASSRQNKNGKKSFFPVLMHGSLLAGFLALCIGTLMVALEKWGIATTYRGLPYALLSVACELGGLAVLWGVALAVGRRLVLPKEFPLSRGVVVFSVFLVVLVIQGFLLEALRLAIQGDAATDRAVSFVGAAVAGLLPDFLKNPLHAQPVYQSLWLVHVATTMAFLAWLPFSKGRHMVTSLLHVLLRDFEKNTRIPAVDIENEQAEYFGVQKCSDLSSQERLGLDACTECRRCSDVCPAFRAHLGLDPAAVMMRLRDVFVNNPTARISEDGVVASSEVWACTQCAACVEACSVGLEPLKILVGLRQYQLLSLGEVPGPAIGAIENTKVHQNPWGFARANKFDWAEGLDVPVLRTESPEVEWLYFVGCAAAFDPAARETARAMVSLLKHAGVSFGVLGVDEPCTGDSVRRLGDEYSYREQASHAIAVLKSRRFQKIVTHCPHCLEAFQTDLRELGGAFEAVHHTQLIAQLFSDGRLVTKHPIPDISTFHDPCFLGRYAEDTQSARQILKKILAQPMQEMRDSGRLSQCCGMGGSHMWFESEGHTEIAQNRVQQAFKTGCAQVVTGCPFCLISLQDKAQDGGGEKALKVVDVAVLVKNALGL